MKIQLNVFKGLALLAAVVALCSTASAGVPYDNTLNYRTNFFFPTPNTREFGDQVLLSTAVPDRIMTRFDFEYYATNIVATGLESLTLRFYANANDSNSPPTALLFSIGPIGVQNGLNTITIDGLNVPIAQNTMTWTVQFNNVATGQAGLPLYYPPTVGENFDDFWQRVDATTWAAFRYPGGVPEGSFAARVTAVPEPTTLMYGALTGLVLVGRRLLRRRS